MANLECTVCGTKVETEDLVPVCPKCGSPELLVIPELPAVTKSEIYAAAPGVWRFHAFLPEVPEELVVTLGEGGTPLLPAKRLGGELGLDNLMIKDETMNPTGSFIDRGSTVLVSLARKAGARRLHCTTTGNLGASLAAYSARAGIEAEIAIDPSIDRAKLYQMIAYGAKVEVHSRRSFDRPGPFSLAVSSGNPLFLEGEKTTGLEIVGDLGWEQPDAVVLPVGTGGHLTMVWRSLLQLRDAGLIEEPSCRVVGAQLRTDVEGRRREGPGLLAELEAKEPSFRKTAKTAMADSGGFAVDVSSKEVVEGMSLLAKNEGIFAEPAAASVVASVRLAKEDGLIDRGDRIVCVVTGSGLKDTRTIGRIARAPKQLDRPDDFMIRPLDVGATKLLVMNALADGAEFGYGIWKSISRERHMTTASVYQHLVELERAALVRRSRVVRYQGRERVYYELTAKGKDLLEVLGKRD